jgi:hypothetical protein
MKASRFFLAALTVTFASACSGADLTGPSAIDATPDWGLLGSGQGLTDGGEVTPQGLLGSGQGRTGEDGGEVEPQGLLGSGQGRTGEDGGEIDPQGLLGSGQG